MNTIDKQIKSPRRSFGARLVLAVLVAAGSAACGGDPSAVKDRDYGGGRVGKEQAAQGLGGQNRETGSLFGPGGLFGAKSGDKSSEGGTGVAVNAYLWRASLDTINFIPLVSADPFGGVIITDWYTPS